MVTDIVGYTTMAERDEAVAPERFLHSVRRPSASAVGGELFGRLKGHPAGQPVNAARTTGKIVLAEAVVSARLEGRTVQHLISVPGKLV